MTIEIANLDQLIPPEVLAALSEGNVMEILQDVADAARNEWIKLAQEGLFSTRRDYVNAVQPVFYTPGMARITLVGVLPNLIEQGMDEQDMHETMLGPKVPVAPKGSPGKRQSKDGGYYRSIPFRHGTPTSGGASGSPMGRPYSGHHAVQDAKKLGRKIYDLAKGLTPTTSQPGGPTAYGGRLKSERDGPSIAPKLRPYHKTNIYEGMIRQQKTYEKSTQNQYVTFRTIAVDAQGNPKGGSPWIRPAKPGKFYSKQVSEFVQKIAPQAFTAYLESVK